MQNGGGGGRHATNNDFDELDSSEQTVQGRRGGGSSRKLASNDDDNYDSKKSSQATLKMRLFRVYYRVSKDRNTSFSGAIALICVMFAQIYDLIISPIMQLPFKGALYAEISEIFDVVRLFPIVVKYGGKDVYWFFMFFPLALCVLYVILIALIDASLRQSKGKSVQLLATLRLLQTLSNLFFWVFMIPFVDFFISIFQCNGDTGFHKYDPTLKCWDAEHAFFCVIFSISLILYVGIIIIISLLYNESRPSHTDSLSRLDTNQELYLTIQRILLVVVSHFTADHSSFQWLTLALHGFICFHLVRSYNHYLPYYNREVSNVYGAFCFGYVWLVANAVLIKALEGDSVVYKGQIIVICIGFALMLPTAKYIRMRRLREVMILKQQEKIKDDLELDQFVNSFQSFLTLQESDSEIQMMFLGFMFMHREECQSQICPLKHNNNLYLPLSDQTSRREAFPSKDRIMHQHFVNSVFLDYQRAHPNTLSAQHHTCYAQFLFYQMGNVHMALIELNLAQKTQHHSSLQQTFTIYKYKQLIEEHLWKKFKEAKASNSGIIYKNNHEAEQQQMLEGGVNGGSDIAYMQAYASLDVTIVIIFENLYNKFEKAIEQSATDHIEFWSHLDSNMIDLNVINKLGLNIINRTKRVMDLWAQLIKINPSYPNALYLYGNYLQQIKNDWDQGEDFKQQYLQVKRLKSLEEYENQFDILFAEDTAVVIMNGSREQQGKIMKTNQGIFKLFGYSMFEVQGHDVNILMPPILAQKHQVFLENYFKIGKERILNSCLETFAMYRTGVIFPVHLVVKPVPSLRNDIQYIGMIKQADRDYEYIITDENGKIDSISEGVISLLKLPISFFKEHEIPVQIIAPQLCEIQKLRNPPPGTPQTATHFEMWTGQKDIKFIVPKNFSNAGGRSGGHFGNQAQQSAPEQNQRDSPDKQNYDIQADGFEKGDKDQQNSDKKVEFIGLRSPESLKIVCSMFKNQDHKSSPAKYLENLRNHINYCSPDFEKTIKVDIQNRAYGANQELRIKVFKIFYNRKKKKQGDGRTNASMAIKLNGGSNNGSDNSTNEAQRQDNKGMKEEETLMHKHGLSALQALNDENFFIKYLEIITQQLSAEQHKQDKNDDLLKEVQVLRLSLERQKRARATGRISTNEEIDRIEIDRMIMNLKDIQNHISLKNDKGSGEGKNYNPIAVAFAHRLAQFAKTQQMLSGRQDSDRRSSARRLRKVGENSDQLEEDFKSSNLNQKDIEKKKSMTGSRAPSQYGQSTQHQDSRNMRDIDSTLQSRNTRKQNELGVRRDFMVDFFQRNIFSHTQQQQHISHNDLVRNLQNKFKATNTPNDIKKDSQDDIGVGTGKDDLNIDAEQRSVKFVVDDSGSVTSDSKSLLSQLRILRNALYENYSPQSIQNLKYSAQFVMLVLVAMTIASFLFSQQKYDQLKENFQSVQHSQVRMQSVTSINTATRFCQLMNDGKVNRYRYNTQDDYLDKMRFDLNSMAVKLQKSQNNLSQTVYDFSNENKYIINSNNVTLYYNTYEEVGQSQKMNIWSAVMQLAVNAYKIKDMPLSNFVDSHMSVWFILRNAMNNILLSVKESTQGILDDTGILSDDNKHILLILLLVASGCLLCSMLIIMPVVTKVHQDKDKLLSLFLQIDQDDVKEQLKRCREFFSTFNNDDKAVGPQPGEHDNDNDDYNDDEDEGHNHDSRSRKSGHSRKSGKDTKMNSQQTPRSQNGKSSEEQSLKQEQSSSRANKFQRKNKKLKKYSTNYLMLLVQFFFVITFLESYFLYQYFQSDNFLKFLKLPPLPDHD